MAMSMGPLDVASAAGWSSFERKLDRESPRTTLANMTMSQPRNNRPHDRNRLQKARMLAGVQV